MCATLCLEKPSLESIVALPSHLIAPGLRPETTEQEEHFQTFSSRLDTIRQSTFPLKKLSWPSPTKALALQSQLKKNILAPLPN